MFRKNKNQAERSKHDDKILEYVLANDPKNLQIAIDKKKYSVIHSADDKGRIAIFEACRLGYRECVEILAAIDMNPLPIDQDGRTPFHVAAMTGNRDCIMALLRRGVGINSIDEHSCTALHLAASQGQLDVLQTLIAYQADTEARDSEQNTPLICAAINNQTEAAVILLNNSVSVNAANSIGRTALMFSSERGNAELLQRLLNCGAQADRKDSSGTTARMLATGHDDCLRLLGADITPKAQATLAPPPSSSPSKSLLLSDAPKWPESSVIPLPRTGSTPSTNTVLNGGDSDTRRQLLAAREEIETLKAQLNAFRTEQDSGDEVEFGSDDEVDLGDAETSGKGSSKSASDDALKKARLDLEEAQSLLKAATKAAAEEKKNLTAQLAAVKADSDKARDGYVPVSEVEALKVKLEELSVAADSRAPDSSAIADAIEEATAAAAASHEAETTALRLEFESQIAELHGELQESAKEQTRLGDEATDARVAKGEVEAQLAALQDTLVEQQQQHAKQLQLYRYYLALAVKDALPAAVVKQINASITLDA